MNKLNDKDLMQLSEGVYSDGNNLYFRVRGKYRKWIFRYKDINGKAIEIGLGSLHQKTLIEAREVSARMNAARKNGFNPKFIIAKQAPWQNLKSPFTRDELEDAALYLKLRKEHGT